MRWILRGDEAQLTVGPWTLQVCLGGESPILEMRSQATEEKLRLVICPNEDGLTRGLDRMPLGDVYVRQNDLIAQFPEHSPWTFGYQVDVRWIDLEDPSCLGLEIWLSVQTSLLDSRPKLSARIGGPSLSEVSDGLWSDASRRFGLLIHPLDESDCRGEAGAEDYLLEIFGRFMEKGVIRRMRFRLIASSESQSARFWTQQLEQFSGSPLPLNT